jgi:hypothetical protein
VVQGLQRLGPRTSAAVVQRTFADSQGHAERPRDGGSEIGCLFDGLYQIGEA